MKKLWAPWRGKYVKLENLKGCIFCDKPRLGKDRKSYILKRSRHSFSMLNIYPYNNGHLMVAPFRHVNDLSKLTKAETQDLMELLKQTKKILDKTLKPQGYNIGLNIGRIAGAGYESHIHMHIVPRWSGDTNFMPILTDTKVMPQALDDLYKQLKKASC